jgi:photosystem II stability/assembly factor-like uncharacterized protein
MSHTQKETVMRVARFAVMLLVALAVIACSTTPPASRVEAQTEARARYKPVTGTESDPEARDRWYWEQRTFPAGSIPIDVHRGALQRELANVRTMAGGEEWTNLGPAPLLDITYGFDTVQNSSGRALTLAVHPQNPSVLLLGTAQGGVWKSTDRGATWRATAEHSLPTLAVNIIKYSPTSSEVVFAGTGEPNGSTSIHGSGLIKSTDGGETWTTLPTQGSGWNFDYQAITGLHFDARNANTMYVSTATITASAAFFKTPPNAPQPGVFKSTDGGQSWTRLRTATKYDVPNSLSVGFMDLEYGGAASPDLMFVSEYFGGILKSTDAGATWRYVTPRKENGLGAFPTAIPKVGYPDSRELRFHSLTRFENPTANADFRRPEIALSASNPQIVYAGYDAPSLRLDFDGNGIFESSKDRTYTTSLLFKSVDGGETWRWLGGVLDGVPDYCGGQCTYDNVITVNANDPNDVWVGGFAYYSGFLPDPPGAPKRVFLTPWRGMIYRSRDGGKSWVDTTPHCTRFSSVAGRVVRSVPVYSCLDKDPTRVIHPDTHAIVLANDGSIYVANDGGLYRTSVTPPAEFRKHRPSGSTRTPPQLAGLAYQWENLNQNLSTLQFYRIGSHPTNPNALLGGMQDNSAGYWDGERWHGWGAGDGTIAIFDPRDPQYVYLGTQFAVHRHDGGGAKAFTEEAGWQWDVFAGLDFESSTERTSFIPVFVLDPVEPSITYGTSNEALYRSTKRGLESRRLGGTQTTDGTPTTVSVSPVDHNVVYLGTNNGTVYRYEIQGLGNAIITRVDTGLPERHVSRVVASHENADTVYAVFNGYDANTPSTPGKVFMSTDRGATWKNISGNLPDVPATALAVDRSNPNRMFLATDAAVYSTSDRGVTWQSERRNMPVVAVQDLDLNPNTGYLVAATHGRGVWRMRVGASSQ